jgi:uncharacterized protein YuzE
MRPIGAKPMKRTIKYQADDNAGYIRLSSGDILESSEVAPNVIFDYDADGHIVGIELLNARAQLVRRASDGRRVDISRETVEPN